MGMSEDRNINEEYGLLDTGPAQTGRNLRSLLRKILLFVVCILLYACVVIFVVVSLSHINF